MPPAATQTRITLGPLAFTRTPGASAPVDVRLGRHLLVTFAYRVNGGPHYTTYLGVGPHQFEVGFRGRGWGVAHLTDDRFGEVQPRHRWATGGWRRLAEVLAS